MRRSISQVVKDQPLGPNTQRLTKSGSVRVRHTRRGGASKLRVMTISRSPAVVTTVPVCGRPIIAAIMLAALSKRAVVAAVDDDLVAIRVGDGRDDAVPGLHRLETDGDALLLQLGDRVVNV